MHVIHLARSEREGAIKAMDFRHTLIGRAVFAKILIASRGCDERLKYSLLNVKIDY
jgi:hypothetical protein